MREGAVSRRSQLALQTRHPRRVSLHRSASRHDDATLIEPSCTRYPSFTAVAASHETAQRRSQLALQTRQRLQERLLMLTMAAEARLLTLTAAAEV